MRLVPRRWHNETWICSIRGHYIPAERAAALRDQDRPLGCDVGGRMRYSRCLRCDLWMLGPAPAAGEEAYDVIPPLEQLDLPRRGKPLEDAILLRLIAIDRGVHAVLFGLLAIGLIFVELRLPAIRDWAQSLVDNLRSPVSETAQAGSHTFLTQKLEGLLHLESGEVTVLLSTAIAYAVVEGIEAVYLWKERRWAEYLTVVATVGFIPFEVYELMNKVTVLRVFALVANVAILAWLVWNKRLFGFHGGEAALQEGIDWATVLAAPTPPKVQGQVVARTATVSRSKGAQSDRTDQRDGRPEAPEPW